MCCQLFKKGAEKLGFIDHEKFGTHALCLYFILKLENDPAVSVKESMTASRHNSVAVQVAYHVNDNVSEANKMNVLGFKISTDKNALHQIL